MKGLMIISNGFEDTEALTTLDVLRRGGLEVNLCSILNNENVLSAHGVLVKSDSLYSQIKLEDYDFLVLPGGPHVYKNLHKNKDIEDMIKYFAGNNKLIAAICAAPSLVSKLGLYSNIKYTCFPGCDVDNPLGKNTGNEIEVYDKFITARSMYYSIPFALAIVENLLGKAKSKELEKQLKGINK